MATRSKLAYSYGAQLRGSMAAVHRSSAVRYTRQRYTLANVAVHNLCHAGD